MKRNISSNKSYVALNTGSSWYIAIYSKKIDRLFATAHELPSVGSQ
ncbi:MAG: hypothetical protein KAT38_06630 [Bacteroidales bacterium]|nr:hypothetical protein [Bacteroidales bacterium]